MSWIGFDTEYDVCQLDFRILQFEDLSEGVQCWQWPESSPEGWDEGRPVVQQLRRPHLHRWRLLGQNCLQHGLPPEIDSWTLWTLVLSVRAAFIFHWHKIGWKSLIFPEFIAFFRDGRDCWKPSEADDPLWPEIPQHEPDKELLAELCWLPPLPEA